jgi:GNAT superfamily N-acetyltransferase
MPYGSESGGNPDPLVSEEERERLLRLQFEQATDELAAESQGRVDAERTDTHEKMRKALNVSADIIIDPAVGRRLAARHNAHVRTQDIARDMFDAYAGTPQQRAAALENLEIQRLCAKEDGVFVFPYSYDFEAGRIFAVHPDGSKEFVIAEASGSHYKPGHMRYGAPKPAADAQFRLPEARYDAMPVFVVPDATRSPVADDLTNKTILERILERPQAVAQLEDIAVDPDMRRLGLASRAIDAGLRHIVERVNPERGAHAIEYVVAEIVSIRGLLLKGGYELYFDDEIEGTAILNDRSLVVFDHLQSDYVTSFASAWTLQNRRVPVDGHDHVDSLIANWYVKAARIKR